MKRSDDPPRLRLVSDRPKGSDWETLPHFAVRPRLSPAKVDAVAAQTNQGEGN
jgi:hypothetical protein